MLTVWHFCLLVKGHRACYHNGYQSFYSCVFRAYSGSSHHMSISALCGKWILDKWRQWPPQRPVYPFIFFSLHSAFLQNGVYQRSCSPVKPNVAPAACFQTCGIILKQSTSTFGQRFHLSEEKLLLLRQFLGQAVLRCWTQKRTKNKRSFEELMKLGWL